MLTNLNELSIKVVAEQPFAGELERLLREHLQQCCEWLQLFTSAITTNHFQLLVQLPKLAVSKSKTVESRANIHRQDRPVVYEVRLAVGCDDFQLVYL